MKNNVYLSIITPCYNAENYIETAIKSVIEQPTIELEMIVVDDGSTDGTAERVKEIADERIKYIRIDNCGAGHARNVGIDNAQGKWVIFLDADDVYLYKVINKQFIEKLKRYEEQNIEIIRTPRMIISMDLNSSLYRIEAKNDVKHHMPADFEFVSCIYRKEYLDRFSIRFYEYRRQDIESAFRYLSFAFTDNIVIDNSMGFYLIRSNPKSNTHTWNIHVLCNIKMKVFWDLYKKTPHKQDRPYLMKTIIRQYVTSNIFNLKNVNQESKEFISDTKELFNTVRIKSNLGFFIYILITKEIAIHFIKIIRNKMKKNITKTKKADNTKQMGVILFDDIKENLQRITEDLR